MLSVPVPETVQVVLAELAEATDRLPVVTQ